MKDFPRFSGSKGFFYERFPEDFSIEGSRSSEVKVYLLKVWNVF